MATTTGDIQPWLDKSKASQTLHRKQDCVLVTKTLMERCRIHEPVHGTKEDDEVFLVPKALFFEWNEWNKPLGPFSCDFILIRDDTDTYDSYFFRYSKGGESCVIFQPIRNAMQRHNPSAPTSSPTNSLQTDS